MKLHMEKHSNISSHGLKQMSSSKWISEIKVQMGKQQQWAKTNINNTATAKHNVML